MPWRVVTRRPEKGTVLIWPEEPGVGEPLEVPAVRFLEVFGTPPAPGAKILLRFRLEVTGMKTEATSS